MRSRLLRSGWIAELPELNAREQLECGASFRAAQLEARFLFEGVGRGRPVLAVHRASPHRTHDDHVACICTQGHLVVTFRGLGVAKPLVELSRRRE
jgi:hypothetical protein